MTWYETYWANLKAAIESAWPEITVIFTDASIERRDWINLLNTKQLTAPWCIVKLTISPSDDWVIDYPCYSVDAEINYVASAKLPASATQSTITDYLMDRLLALTAVLQSSVSLGTVMTEMPIAINADAPINVVLLDAKIPYQSGSLTVTTLIVDAGEDG